MAHTLGWDLVLALSVFLAFGGLCNGVLWLFVGIHSGRREPFARDPSYCPPVSIVKPVRGLADGDAENFETFFQLDYPRFEILFVIHRDAGDDPSLRVIERLIASHPNVDARVIRATETVAVHEKVNNYIEAIAKSRYDIINITDADTYVRPDNLRHEVAALSNPDIAMVFSVQTMNHYRGSGPAFEGLVQNGDNSLFIEFLDAIGMTHWIIGHSTFFRKADFYAFDAIGTLRWFLNDDQAWGEIMCDRGGKRIWLSKRVTHTRNVSGSWRRSADHILRWGAFFVRMNPAYVLLPIIQNSFFGLLTVALSFLPGTDGLTPFGFLQIPMRSLGLILGAGTVALRVASNVLANLRYGDDHGDLRYFWTIPLRDIFAIWVSIATPFMRTITHAGRVYSLKRPRS